MIGMSVATAMGVHQSAGNRTDGSSGSDPSGAGGGQSPGR